MMIMSGQIIDHIRPRGRPPIIKLHFPTREALDEELRKGRSLRQIAFEIGVTPGAMTNHIRENGWELEIERRLVEAA